jgi:hypothetical protein
MFRRSLLCSAALAASVVIATSRSLFAQAMSVGTGPDMVQVLFNWPDGFVADYDVYYGSGPSSTIVGYDATEDCTADPNLSLTWTNYGTTQDPDYFLDIASYTGGHTGNGDTYNGVTAPNNYWHEWYTNGGPWIFGDGASVDTLDNGGEIGWVFGSNATPVPEPTSCATLVGAAVLLMRRRRGIEAKLRIPSA